MRTIIRIEKWLPEKVRTKLGSTKIILIDRCTLIVREPFLWFSHCWSYRQVYVQTDIFFPQAWWIYNVRNYRWIWKVSLRFLPDLQSAIQAKKWQISWKENWTPLLRSTEESIVNQNSFRVLSILYITNFCETRKINSNAIRVPFLLLNFQKIRKCALN